MAKSSRVRHNRRKCIGCGACVKAAPQSWILDPYDGLSKFIEGKETSSGEWYGDIHDEDLVDNVKASEVCPVKIIHIDE